MTKEKPRRKKKDQPSNKAKVIGILIIAALVVSTIGIFLTGGPKTTPLPSPQNFKSQDWMSYIPADAYEFRFLNITKLSAFPDLLSSTVLSISDPAIQVNLSEITFGVDLIYSNYAGVSILGIGASARERVFGALQSSNITPSYSHGIPVYKIPASNGSATSDAWLCIYNNSLLYSEGDTAAYQAIDSIIGNSQLLFDNDSYKTGYLLATGGSDAFVVSYYRASSNQFNISWVMSAAFGTTSIVKHDVFSFPSRELASAQYSAVVKNVIGNASAVYLSGPYMLAVDTYPLSDIRYVLMSL
ncbi:MAG: hypothetical protein ACO0C9_01335 [Candidatus Methanosuratincola verstraetei]|jgi:hypothetical protein|uniref:Uncharacterized protein n=1 Tax=Methanosuratincola subterraneus TaxID=2593994 RepID=A0A444L915_METS7|nr:MAG: hypothetical protein Metus_0090 [Candidatus Methanosuratincola subterraneus]